MAFHLHLINPLSSFVPGAAPKLQRTELPTRRAASQLCLVWDLGIDGRPTARWVQA